ncbi:MAG: hypothetical protein HY270_23225 [Deltaproteobacteria bacterium]|nr:hypothetical protein [Deltaproteobacteria bacterium]
MTKTMFLLLGAKPMSMYDRYATDMRDYFTSTPDLTPYTAKPRIVPVEYGSSADQALNLYARRATELSAKLDLTTFDQDGEKMIEVLQLVKLGERVEQQKGVAMSLVCAMVMSLITGGALVRRRTARA